MGGSHDSKYSYTDVRSPRGDLNTVDLALMTPKQREGYYARKERRRQRSLSYERFLCNVLLTPATHSELKHAASETNQTYDSLIFNAVRHFMTCAARFEEKEEKEE
jgi:hypothetical protein